MFLIFRFIVSLLVLQAVAVADSRPKFILVMHGDLIGQNVVVWSPTVAAALSCGKFSEVHIIGNLGSAIVPQTDAKTGTKLYSYPLKGFDATHSSVFELHMLDYHPHSDLKQAVDDSMRYMRENGIQSAESMFEFITSNEAIQSKNNSVKTVAERIGLFRKDNIIDAENAAGKISLELDFKTNLIEEFKKVQNLEVHNETIKNVVSKTVAGDVVVSDSAFITGNSLMEPFEGLDKRRVRFIQKNIGEKEFDDIRRKMYGEGANFNTRAKAIRQYGVEDYGYELVQWLGDSQWDWSDGKQNRSKLVFSVDKKVTKEQVHEIYAKKPPVEIVKQIEGVRRELFKDLTLDPSSISFDLYNFYARHRGHEVEKGADQLLALLEHRILTEPSRVAMIAPGGIPPKTDTKIITGIETLKIKYPKRIIDASDKISVRYLYNNLISTAKLFITPVTGAAHIGLRTNPAATHMVVPAITESRDQRAGANAIEKTLEIWFEKEGNYHPIFYEDKKTPASEIAKVLSDQITSAIDLSKLNNSNKIDPIYREKMIKSIKSKLGGICSK